MSDNPDGLTDDMPPRAKSRRGGMEFMSIAAAGVGVQLLTLISGPLVARMLGPNGRGEMVMITVITLLCSLIGVGGLPAAIAHTIGTAHAPARDVVRGQIRLWLAFPVLPAAVAVGLTFAFLSDSSRLLFLSAAAFFVTLLTCWNLLLAAMLQGEGNVRHVNALRLAGLISYVGGVIAIFVVHRTREAAILLFIYAGAQVVGLCVGWTRLQKPTGDPALRSSRADVHRFARRSFVSGLSTLDGLGIDHLLVGAMLGQASLGLYAVAVSVTNLPTIVLSGVAAILLPRMAAQSAPRGIALLRRWLVAAIALDVVLVVGLQIVIAPAIHIAFGEEFVPATTCARILIVAWAFLALRRILTAAAQAQGNAGKASVIEAVCAVILIAGVVVGGGLYGIEGAGLAMAIAGAVSCGLLAILVSWRVPDNEADTEKHPDVGITEVVAIDDADLRLL